MASILFPYGSVVVTVPAGEKIAIFSNKSLRLFQKVGYPNYPDSWNLIETTTDGEQYVSAAFTDATDVRVEAGAADAFYETGAAPAVAEPQADITAADATFDISGLAAAQGGYVRMKGGTSSTAGNAGGAASLLGGVPGATGVGGAVSITGGAGGATSGAGGVATVAGGAGTAGNGSGGNVVLQGGTAHGTGITGHVIARTLFGRKQGTPTAKTTDATLTISELLTGILTGTHSVGATQTYTLPTGTLTDGSLQFINDDAFDWHLINLSAAAADTITVAAGVGHTIVGNPIVQSAHSSTGGIYGNSAHFRTRRTAANTYVTYRLA